MAENKKSEFTVTDKRRFTSEGDVSENPQEQPAVEEVPAPPVQAANPAGPQEVESTEKNVPPPPSAEERQAQHDAFKQSSKELDDALAGKMGGRTAKDFEVTFERFAASLYMSALVQLGLVHEQGAQPQVDLIGARQSIDTLGMISEKTKGNLTPTEENLLQNCLYELRMAYVDVTNMLTRPPQPGQSGPGGMGGPGGPIPFPGKK
jgi:Domain of unknown function (DUF1844)